MTKYQKEYWERQKQSGNIKVTIVLSKPAHEVLIAKKKSENMTYSRIIEQALIKLLDHGNRTSNNMLPKSEKQLNIVHAECNNNTTKIDEIENQLLSFLTNNEQRLTAIEKQIKLLKPKRKKRVVK